MSNLAVIGCRIVTLVLAASSVGGACGGSSRKGGLGSGGHAGIAGVNTGGQGAGSGGSPTGAPGGAGAGSDRTGGAGASGGSPAAGGGRGGVGPAGMGATAGPGAGGAGGAAKAMDPYFGAGTRLKPGVFQAGDLKVLDSTAELSWFDSDTGAACRFLAGPDGVERCVPSAGADGAFYSDARCTKGVWLGSVPNNPSCGGATSPYVTIVGSSACDHRVYRVGAPSASKGPIYYWNAEGVCAKHVDRVENGVTVQPLEDAALDRFVAVKRVSRPRSPHMDALVREGDDGSFEVVGMIDPVRRAPCFSLGLGVSPPVCVPGWQPTEGAFDSASCTRPVGFEVSDPWTCPTRSNSVLLKVDYNAAVACREQSIGGIWEIAGSAKISVFVQENGMCQSNGNPAATAKVFLAGAPLDVASLPRLELIDVGTGPLKVRFYGFDGVPFFPAPAPHALTSAAPPAFIDAATSELCDPYPFADGQWRCVPSSFTAVMDSDVLHASNDCTGVRLFDRVTPRLCSETAREPRGLVVKTLKVQQVCGYDRIVETFGVTGRASRERVSSGIPMASCHYSGDVPARPFYEADKPLNAADVFVSLQRKLSD